MCVVCVCVLCVCVCVCMCVCMWTGAGRIISSIQVHVVYYISIFPGWDYRLAKQLYLVISTWHREMFYCHSYVLLPWCR